MKNRIDGDAGEILADIRLGGIEYPGVSLTTKFVLQSVTMPEEITPNSVYKQKLSSLQTLLGVSDEVVQGWNHGSVTVTHDGCMELLSPKIGKGSEGEGEVINPPG